MLLEHGVTTVADIEAVPELLPEVTSSTPLRICSLFEVTGVRSRRAPARILADAAEKIDALAAWAGLSPHAPYSTTPELLRRCGDLARERRWPMAIHVAESREEFQMMASASGSMFEWLEGQRDMSDCGLGSPVEHLHRHGLLGPNLLAVHVNYLGPGDADLLGSSGTSVVHCPRSHAYFRHRSFPWARLSATGVNICLGTDSMATVRLQNRQAGQLDLWTEMRTMADQQPDLKPEMLLRFATIHGARALGCAGKLGQISPGSRADLVTVPLARPGRDLYAAALGHIGPVHGVMINGRWVKSSPS
jgi:cytosine/adenosine deaminase-related metal-dependent hydrolase